MTSSSYCQGLQSCLEPSHLAEPRVLRLKLAPQNSNASPPPPPPPPNPNPYTLNTTSTEQEEEQQMGGWSFLQSLSSDVHSSIPIYNPPSIKRSPSFLCEKSLEMCTESLGSETGSEVSEGAEKMEENMASLAFLSLENAGEYSHQEGSGSELGSGSGGSRRRKNKYYKRSITFPPPLTSISGSSGVQVRPYREEGRLVLKAVSLSSCQGYFQAERSNGRLTLRLTKGFDYGDQEETEEEAEEEEEMEVEEEAEKKEAENWKEEELEGNIGKGGVGKVATRPISRCKECENGNKGLLSWGEPCWVAT